MLTWTGLPPASELRPLRGGAVTIGMFDGVHRGHQELLRTAQSLAVGKSTTVVTFIPHPAAVVRPGSAPPLLTSPQMRLRLLEKYGMDATLVLEFTPGLARWTPEEFVDRVLGPLAPETVVVGADFRFGSRASGDVELLSALGAQRGFTVASVPLVEQGQTRVSSSSIRRLIEAGDLASATELLGRPYSLEGTVVPGQRRGRELGYPTANLDVGPDLLIPADGIYAGRLQWGDAQWDKTQGNEMEGPAAISIGTNPTFGGAGRTVEAYVLDRTDLDLYGRPVLLTLTHRLRPMVAFASIDSLQVQMAADVAAVRALEYEPRPAPGSR